jgi:hypothetical protein
MIGGANHTDAIAAAVHLAVVLLLLGVAAMGLWRLWRPAPLHRLRAACTMLLLALLPGYFFMRGYPDRWKLFLHPDELWRKVEEAYYFGALEPGLGNVGAALGALLMLALCLAAAAGRPRTSTLRALAAVLVCALAVPPVIYAGQAYIEAQALADAYAEGWSRFAQQCKAAGPRVLNTVQGEAGIRLTGLRAEAPNSRFTEQDWPGAGLPHDSVGQRYIASFLSYEDHGSAASGNFALSLPSSVSVDGFDYVDVANSDGTFLRYRLAPGGVKGALSTEVIDAAQAARYAVAYARNDSLQERRYWVAGAKVTVTDTHTGALMGEFKSAAFVRQFAIKRISIGRNSWYEARTCPNTTDMDHNSARRFVERVVAPARR